MKNHNPGTPGTSRTIRLFHRTSIEAQKAILLTGFEDHEGTYGTRHLYKGVWLSDRPLNAADMWLAGPALIEVTMPESVVRPYEWIEN